jgi:histidinol-phosphate aminotransferase
VIAALRAMEPTDVAFYPDYGAVTAACARRFGVRPDQVLLTNGLDEGILVAALAALRGAGGDAVVVEPAFDMYAACAAAAGARIVHVAPAPDFAFPLAAVLDALSPATRVVFLTNPNNPTGQPIPRDAIEAILQRAAPALVLLDEAYVDFGAESFLDPASLDRHPNLVVGRTFAKAYGLAGVRAGALAAAVGTLAPMRAIVPPYSVNAAAVAALQAALEDDGHYRWYLEQVERSKALIYAACARLGLGFWPSAANFVLVHAGGRAAALVEGLARRGVAVRDRSAEPGCAGCVRITAGVVAHTQACLAALEEVLCDAP